MNTTPPRPTGRTKAALLGGFFSQDGRSMLNLLPERAYNIQMAAVRFVRRALFIVNAPATIRRVMVEDVANFPKHAFLVDILEPLVGHSLFNTNGEAWARQRRLVDQAFVQAGLRQAFPLMKAAVDELLQRTEAVADGRVWDADVAMSHVTADIIFRTVLSSPLDAPQAKQVHDAFRGYQASAQRVMGLSALHLPTFFHRWRCRRLGAAIRQPYARLIRERYQAIADGQASQHQDMLSTLIHARDPKTGEGFSEEEVVGQVGTLFLAGHETSATTLGWALYLMACRPDMQDAVRKEVVEHWGEGEPDFGDTRQLSLTHDVFRETLRLYPPIPFYLRQAAEPVCLRDKTVNAGELVVVSPWLVQRHRGLWERPDEFDPHRFCTEAGLASAKTAYLPFGLGPRACPGAAFATQEGLLVLAQLVRRYRIETVDGHTPKPAARLTLRSANGVQLRLTRLTGIAT